MKQYVFSLILLILPAVGMSQTHDMKFPFDQLPVEFKSVRSNKCLDVVNAGTTNGSNVQQFTCTAARNQTWFLSFAGPGSYQIRAGHVGNKNLDIEGGSLLNGANAQIYDTVTDAQIFGLVRQSDGSYEIVSKKSLKCLDVVNGSTSNHANVQQYTCHGGSNQRWWVRFRPIAMNLIAKHSSKCIDVAGGFTADTTNIQQYTCHDGDNQKWSIGSTTTVNGVSYFTLVARHSGKCMDVAGGSTADHANVQQYTCHAGDNQKWSITANSDGYVTIKNKRSGKCLDVADASTSNHANIQQYTCHGGSNQRWWWSILDNRHVHVVQVAQSSGAARLIQSDTAIAQHVARANGVYGRYGLQLLYDAASDKSDANSDALYSLGSSSTFTCPDGTTGTPDVCATRYAANWPNKVVIFSRPGNGYTAGNATYIVIGQLGSNAKLVCIDVPDTQWLAHEFGHYMGLNHTFFSDGDLLPDTRPDPQAAACLAAHSATGTVNGATVDTNNAMSYYYNDTVVITPMQASLTRAAAFARGY